MDSKTRVMKSVNFERADRIGRFDEFWPEFREKVVEHFSLPDDVLMEDFFEIDIHIAVPDETIRPTKAEKISEDGEYVVERSGWGSIWRHKKDGYFYQFVEAAVPEGEDFDKLEFDPASLDSRYDEWKKEVDRARSKGKCVFGKIGGPYFRTAFVRGETEFLMDIAGDPAFAEHMVHRMADHLLAIGKEELKRGSLCDTGIWIFDDMGNNRAPMMSPRQFERIFYPAYQKIVQGLKAAGAAKVGLHSDGNILPLLDMFVDIGIDILNPVEPRAGMSIPALRRKYGKKLAYVGGMCNSLVLPSGSREEIIRQVREILEVAQDGGVVIGAHSIGPDISIASYMAYYETVMKEGVFQ